MKCSQSDCEEEAVFSAWWPTGEKIYSCIAHAVQTDNLCAALGYSIHHDLLPIEDKEKTP